MRLRFVTADVFTDQPFGGNPLAVFLDGRGLPTETMQRIAQEMNLAETVFVLPPEKLENTRRIRIFTPASELPFAGHPTVGTAVVLAHLGEIPRLRETPSADGETRRIVLEEGVGAVPVTIRFEGGVPVFAQLTAAVLPEFGPPPPPAEELAALLSIEPGDVITGDDFCQNVSCGVPFLFIPLRNRDALRRARVRVDRWDALFPDPGAPLYLFAYDPELPGSQIRARMFAPGLGIPEDPATGGAVAALGGYLGVRAPEQDGTLRWRIEQGFEMGRPSLIHLEVEKRGGAVTAVRVGGGAVLMSEGTMEIPD